MTHTIAIIESKLSDGSFVYAVRLGQAEPIPAVSERDAQLMAEQFTLAIRNYSNDEVHTRYTEVAA